MVVLEILFLVIKEKYYEEISFYATCRRDDLFICHRLRQECREQYQFYLGQFYNAIGVSYNTNTKRERLITAEVETADDTLMINIADMLYQRKKACDDINTMFGTSISVDFSEEWKKIDKAMEPEVSPAKQDEGVSENDAVEDADNSGS